MNPHRMRPYVPLAALCIAAAGIYACAKRHEGEPPEAASAEPSVADGFVYHPRFRTKDMEFSAGSGFFVHSPLEGQPPILLTALHLIGPGGGFHRQARFDDLKSLVSGMGLREAFLGTAAPQMQFEAASIEGSAPLGEDSEAGDIAAFFLRSDATPHLGTLSSVPEPPQPGNRVWLAASIDLEGPAMRRIHPGTVFENADGFVYYWFDDSELDLHATSGAPLLNRDGIVIGIHLGGATEGERLYGVANPVARFLPHLTAACRPEPAIAESAPPAGD